MKKLSILLIFVIGFTNTINAQDYPKKAEDISPLLVGETLPNISLKGIDGNKKKLKTILEEKPSVLIFYRGGWCPYCNSQLSGLMNIEKEIVNLGYQIIAITPENQENLKNTVEKTKVDYSLYTDEGGELIKKMGIAFKTNTKTKLYASAKSKGKVSEVLPVPTVMIVDKKGNILYEYINPNYRVRLTGKMLLAVLKNIEPIN